MNPELEEYLSADNALANKIAGLKRELEDTERARQRALNDPRVSCSWREFIVILLVAALLLNSLAVHMGAQLGWWDPNQLVGTIDQRVTALNTYESETAPLVYGAHALGWLCGTILYIFFALPYQLLVLVEELLSMVLPMAVPYLPYVEGVILGVVALNMLKTCPLFRGIANKEVKRCKRRIREIEREIEAKEVERSKLPSDKVAAARQAEAEERRQREAEERQRREEAERQRREQEDERRRREERERQLQKEREEAETAVKRRLKELYESVHGDSGMVFDEPDMLVLGYDADDEAELVEILRTFCPDDRCIFSSRQMDQALERLRHDHDVAVVLLASDDRSREQLCWFLSTDFMASETVVLRVTHLAWENEDGERPRVKNFVDSRAGIRGLEVTANRLDILALESIYTYPISVAVDGGSRADLFRAETRRRFVRYRDAARRAREGWHIEGDTLVLDGRLSTVDGRVPWAEKTPLFSRVVARDGADISEYAANRAAFFPNGRMEGLFEGWPYLRSADLRKLRIGFARFDELQNAFDGCAVLDEVYVPDNPQLATGLWKNGYDLADDGCWRPTFLIAD